MIVTTKPRRATPAEPEGGDRVSILGLKASRRYKAWLDDLIASRGKPAAWCVREALEDYARKHGFAPPPAEGRKGGA